MGKTFMEKSFIVLLTVRREEVQRWIFTLYTWIRRFNIQGLFISMYDKIHYKLKKKKHEKKIK